METAVVKMEEKEPEVFTPYSPPSHLKVDETTGEMEPEVSSPNYDLIFPPFRMAPFRLRTPDLDRMEDEEPEAEHHHPTSGWTRPRTAVQS